MLRLFQRCFSEKLVSRKSCIQMNDLILILCKGTSGFLGKRERIFSLIHHFTMITNQINDILMVPILEQLRFLPG